MKHLVETWRHFVLKESYAKDNIVALYQMPVNGYKGVETFKSKFILNYPQIQNVVSQIKVLQNNKIVRPAGAGKYGITYVLDNDHILKFFAGAFKQNADDEIKKYKDMQDRQFQGTSHKGEPAVYDFGVAQNENLPIYYVELGKVIPFDEWIKMNKQDTSAWEEVLGYTARFFKEFYNEIKSMDTREITRRFLNMFDALKDKYKGKTPSPERSKTKNIKPPTTKTSRINKNGDEEEIWEPVSDITERNIALSGVSQQALVGLIKSLVLYVKKTGKVTDFHSGNFGIIPSNNSKEPDTFVFFDI